MTRTRNCWAAGAAMLLAAGAANAAEPGKAPAVFGDAGAISAGELAQMSGREALAVPLADAINYADLDQDGAGDGISVLSQHFIQAIVTQVATAVSTAVALDLEINAGNIVIGGR